MTYDSVSASPHYFTFQNQISHVFGSDPGDAK